MGLDVYLYHYTKPVDEAMKIEEIAGKKTEEFKGGLKKKLGIENWDAVPKSNKDKYYKLLKKWYKENGLTEWGDIPEGELREKIEIDSAKYPDHLFKIGYFRSSYNSGGINWIMRERLNGKDLGWIFEPVKEYVVRPDWNLALVRARQMLEEFQDYVAKSGSYGVITFRNNDFMNDSEFPGDAGKALKVFNEERKRSEGYTKEMKNFGSRNGEFYFGEPLSVVALVSGTCPSFTSMSPRPCTYVVYDNKEGMDWYVNALEIVIETCEWVLKQEDDQKQYLLHWSG